MLTGRCFPHPAALPGPRARLLAATALLLPLLLGWPCGSGKLHAGDEAAPPWTFPLRPEDQASLPWWAGDAWRLGGEETPAAENPAIESQPTPDTLRARLAAEVKNGRLVPRGDDGERKITFRPLRRAADPPAGATAAPLASPPEAVKEPGPLEDAALAAAVRSRIAADPELGKLGVTVASQLGRLTLRANGAQGGPTPEQTAALLNLARAVDNVIEVTTDLPAAPAPRQP